MSDETMMWDEVADIGALLHELDDEAFDTPPASSITSCTIRTSGAPRACPERSLRPACTGPRRGHSALQLQAQRLRAEALRV